jgi:hypothetical protein
MSDVLNSGSFELLLVLQNANRTAKVSKQEQTEVTLEISNLNFS